MRYIDFTNIRVFLYFCYDFIGILPNYLDQPSTSGLTIRHTFYKLYRIWVFLANIFYPVIRHCYFKYYFSHSNTNFMKETLYAIIRGHIKQQKERNIY